MHLRTDRSALHWVLKLSGAHIALVGEVIKSIVGRNGLGTTLLVPEYEINPLMQTGRHEVAFQSLTLQS